jgi:hypothetical protein
LSTVPFKIIEILFLYFIMFIWLGNLNLQKTKTLKL